MVREQGGGGGGGNAARMHLKSESILKTRAATTEKWFRFMNLEGRPSTKASTAVESRFELLKISKVCT